MFLAKFGLTGKKRYRLQKRWFRAPLLVLQVQEDGFWYGYNGAVERLPKWRDAQLQDLESDNPTYEVKS